MRATGLLDGGILEGFELDYDIVRMALCRRGVIYRHCLIITNNKRPLEISLES
jgi:hypothetical protein